MWLDKNRLTASGPLKSTVVRIWYWTPFGRPHKVYFVSLACLPSVFVRFICVERHFFTCSQLSSGAFPIKNKPQMNGDKHGWGTDKYKNHPCPIRVHLRASVLIEKKDLKRKKPAATYFPALAVSSAQEGLTSVFGMGTGIAPPLWPPAFYAMSSRTVHQGFKTGLHGRMVRRRK